MRPMARWGPMMMMTFSVSSLVVDHGCLIPRTVGMNSISDWLGPQTKLALVKLIFTHYILLDLTSFRKNLNPILVETAKCWCQKRFLYLWMKWQLLVLACKYRETIKKWKDKFWLILWTEKGMFIQVFLKLIWFDIEKFCKKVGMPVYVVCHLMHNGNSFCFSVI